MRKSSSGRPIQRSNRKERDSLEFVRTSSTRIQTKVSFSQRTETGQSAHRFVGRGVTGRMSSSFSFVFRFDDRSMPIRRFTTSAGERGRISATMTICERRSISDQRTRRTTDSFHIGTEVESSDARANVCTGNSDHWYRKNSRRIRTTHIDNPIDGKGLKSAVHEEFPQNQSCVRRI